MALTLVSFILDILKNKYLWHLKFYSNQSAVHVQSTLVLLYRGYYK